MLPISVQKPVYLVEAPSSVPTTSKSHLSKVRHWDRRVCSFPCCRAVRVHPLHSLPIWLRCVFRQRPARSHRVEVPRQHIVHTDIPCDVQDHPFKLSKSCCVASMRKTKGRESIVFWSTPHCRTFQQQVLSPSCCFGPCSPPPFSRHSVQIVCVISCWIQVGCVGGLIVTSGTFNGCGLKIGTNLNSECRKQTSKGSNQLRHGRIMLLLGLGCEVGHQSLTMMMMIHTH